MAVKKMVLHHLGEQRYVGFNETGQQVLIDNSATKVGPSPMEVLLGALAACTAVDVVEIMRKRKTPLAAYRIEAEGERAEGIPARYVKITLRHIGKGEGVTREQLEKAAHLSHEKYCSVAASLNCPVEVTAEVEA
ncbi:OsmC family protein [Deinococcus cellulosilyticus]|uniref:OsmC family protein n=1 Tax=Deinococcus cellulosilyticus (strain DSM 18568 / NBRC 106333 / KACC 11606 / 5516J-15) TaxID=1223518 RepID=A0A511N5U6_DEIC1|nr:OsmC family protein [Deinococcus cellulosilyticus]GEM48232.1 hypothetical protein DC3_38670 [Deinococcus cellulosilyticus NBRC 106333 = KACC 11606]